MKSKFKNPNVSAMKCASKMHVAHLKSHNANIPNKLDNNKKGVSDHKQSMNSKSKKKEIKVELIIRTSYKLAAQLMASNEKNIENTKTYCE